MGGLPQEAFARAEFRANDPDSPYAELMAELPHLAISSELDFVFKLLVSRVETIDSYPQLDFNEFYHTIFELSRYQTRENRAINNRVDAHNYCLVQALNKTYVESGRRYILVSNTQSLINTDQHNNRRQQKDLSEGSLTSALVWPPKATAIHQLTQLAVSEDVEPDRFCWQIVERIVSYRLQLSKLLRKHDSPYDLFLEADKERVDDAYIHLISSLSALQDMLSTKRLYARIDDKSLWSDRELRINPDQLFEEVKKTLDKVRYSEFMQTLVIPHQTPGKNGDNLQFRITNSMTNDSLINAVVFDKNRKTENVMGLYKNSSFFGFYFQSVGSYEEFLGLANFLLGVIDANFSAGMMTKEPNGSQFVLVGIAGSREFQSVPFSRVHLSMLDICKKLEITPNRINFMRINSRWFDSSFELTPGNSKLRHCGFATHIDFTGAMEIFIRELIEPKFKYSTFKSPIAGFLSYQPSIEFAQRSHGQESTNVI